MSPIVITDEQQFDAFFGAAFERFCKTHGISLSGQQPIEIIDVAELCKRLGLSEQTIIQYRKLGKIPFLQIGSAIRYNFYSVISELEKIERRKK